MPFCLCHLSTPVTDQWAQGGKTKEPAWDKKAKRGQGMPYGVPEPKFKDKASKPPTFVHHQDSTLPAGLRPGAAKHAAPTSVTPVTLARPASQSHSTRPAVGKHSDLRPQVQTQLSFAKPASSGPPTYKRPTMSRAQQREELDPAASLKAMASAPQKSKRAIDKEVILY